MDGSSDPLSFTLEEPVKSFSFALTHTRSKCSKARAFLFLQRLNLWLPFKNILLNPCIIIKWNFNRLRENKCKTGKRNPFPYKRGMGSGIRGDETREKKGLGWVGHGGAEPQPGFPVENSVPFPLNGQIGARVALFIQLAFPLLILIKNK